jgi:nucleotide-binding universal stress UspA family protein
MKSLLVAVSGTCSDKSVLDAAYAVAVPLKAHLDLVHIPLASIGVADFNRHIEFARGSGLEIALEDTFSKSADAEARARAHVMDFCTFRNILHISQPTAVDRVTASWTACSINPDIDGFMQAARAHDLIVVGRSAGKRSWSQNLLESLAMDCGRPVLIVPPGSDKLTLNRIAIWWKDHSAAARAVSAALPLLAAAGKVSVISVLEKDDDVAEGAVDMAKQLGWHGIEAAIEPLGRGNRTTINMLWSAGLAAKADLVVMGGFSRSRMREMIFGGCTQAVLETGVLPVFLLH